MVQDTGDFAEQGTDPLGALGNLDVQQLLNSQGEALLVGHHGNIVQTVEVRQRLEVCLVLDQLLGTAVQQTDVGVGAHNLLSVQFQNQAQHTVRGGVLRTEVHCVMSDLALFRSAGLVVRGVEGHGIRVHGRAEVGVHGDEASGIGVLDGLGEASGGCRREGAVLAQRGGKAGLRAKTRALGPIGGQASKGCGHGCCMLNPSSGGAEDVAEGGVERWWWSRRRRCVSPHSGTDEVVKLKFDDGSIQAIRGASDWPGPAAHRRRGRIGFPRILRRRQRKFWMREHLRLDSSN